MNDDLAISVDLALRLPTSKMADSSLTLFQEKESRFHEIKGTLFSEKRFAMFTTFRVSNYPTPTFDGLVFGGMLACSSEILFVKKKETVNEAILPAILPANYIAHTKRTVI